MNLEDILSGQKPADDEITKRLKFRTLKSRIATRAAAIPTDFLANIERNAEAIAKGDLAALGLYELRDSVTVEEDTKRELFHLLGELAQKKIGKTAATLNRLFCSSGEKEDDKEEKKEEPKVEIQVSAKPEVPPASAGPAIFGY